MKRSILILNGPNLNLLGTREPEIYGRRTLEELEKLCVERARSRGIEAQCLQFNGEGQMIDAIHEARGKHQAIVINPGAYSHTSIAIADALVGVGLPVYEVHLSDIKARESFRHHSYVAGVAKEAILGRGAKGYLDAIDKIADELDEGAK